MKAGPAPKKVRTCQATRAATTAPITEMMIHSAQARRWLGPRTSTTGLSSGARPATEGANGPAAMRVAYQRPQPLLPGLFLLGADHPPDGGPPVREWLLLKKDPGLPVAAE